MDQHQARAAVGAINRGGFMLKDMYQKHGDLCGDAVITLGSDTYQVFFQAPILDVCEPNTPIDIVGLLARINDKVRDAVLLGFFFGYLWDGENDEPNELGKLFPEIYPGITGGE